MTAGVDGAPPWPTCTAMPTRPPFVSDLDLVAPSGEDDVALAVCGLPLDQGQVVRTAGGSAR
jgi:hypothetical protein